MFYLKIVRFTKAKKVFEKFQSKEYKLEKGQVEIEFDSDINLGSSKYAKVRQITYLSSYDPK